MVSKMKEKERPAAMTQRRQRPPESVDLKYVAVEYRDTREICSKYNIVLHNMFLNYFAAMSYKNMEENLVKCSIELLAFVCLCAMQ